MLSVHEFSPYFVDFVSAVPLHNEECLMAANFQYAILTLSPPFYSSTDMFSRPYYTIASQPLLVVLLFSQVCLLKRFYYFSNLHSLNKLKSPGVCWSVHDSLTIFCVVLFSGILEECTATFFMVNESGSCGFCSGWEERTVSFIWESWSKSGQ